MLTFQDGKQLILVHCSEHIAHYSWHFQWKGTVNNTHCCQYQLKLSFCHFQGQWEQTCCCACQDPPIWCPVIQHCEYLYDIWCSYELTACFHIQSLDIKSWYWWMLLVIEYLQNAHRSMFLAMSDLSRSWHTTSQGSWYQTLCHCVIQVGTSGMSGISPKNFTANEFHLTSLRGVLSIVL